MTRVGHDHIHVVLQGHSVPQGSMKHVGRGILRHSNADGIALFRAQVGIATRAAVEAAGVVMPLEGPLRLSCTFALPKPKSAPKRRIWPDRRPDLDKLVRSLGDAITQCGLWTDDAQVVQIIATKIYVVPVGDWQVPGCEFTVETIAP